MDRTQPLLLAAVLLCAIATVAVFTDPGATLQVASFVAMPLAIGGLLATAAGLWFLRARSKGTVPSYVRPSLGRWVAGVLVPMGGMLLVSGWGENLPAMGVGAALMGFGAGTLYRAFVPLERFLSQAMWLLPAETVRAFYGWAEGGDPRRAGTLLGRLLVGPRARDGFGAYFDERGDASWGWVKREAWRALDGVGRGARPHRGRRSRKRGERRGRDRAAAAGRRGAEDAAWARAVLGVGPDAGADAIKEAYRRKARDHHPDSGGDPSGRAMRRVNRAYEVLLGARR